LEDDLMRIFGGDKIKNLMTVLKVPEDEPIQAGMISGAIESAQEKIEGFNFDARHHLLEYDDVLNKHREIIYKKRKGFLESENLKEKVLESFEKSGINKKEFEKKEKEIGEENMKQMGKNICLRVLDMLWQEHLSYMDHIRDSVRLRAYSGRDPLVEYKNEGHKAFGQLLKMLDANIADNILKAGIQVQQKKTLQSHAVESGKKEIGRNDLCPCGSGKKYKRCHGK
jgi:preprotein translocase subunit SecA